MIEKMKEVFNGRDVSESNALQLILNLNNTNEERLIRRYIISQLEIKYHLYNLTETIGYDGDCAEPLRQILRNEDPVLWQKIIDEENNRKSTISAEDVENRVDIKCIIPNEIEKLEEQLKTLKENDFTTKAEIENKIKSLQLKQDQSKIMLKGFSQRTFELDEEQILQKENDFDEFCKIYIPQYEKTYGKDYTYLKDYLRDHASKYENIDKLKEDIVLHYNMCKFVFTANYKDMSMNEIVAKIREQFREYAMHGLSEVVIDGDIRKLDLEVSISSPSRKFMKSCAKGTDVKTEMEKLNDDYENMKCNQNQTTDETIKSCVDIFQKFIKIHPFPDGNGRTSRYLLSAMLVSKNIMPPVLYDTYMDRKTLDSLSNEYLFNDNKSALNEYVLNKIKEIEVGEKQKSPISQVKDQVYSEDEVTHNYREMTSTERTEISRKREKSEAPEI